MTRMEYYKMGDRGKCRARNVGLLFLIVALIVWIWTGDALIACIPLAATAGFWKFWLEPGEDYRFQYDDETLDEFTLRKRHSKSKP